MSYDFFVNLLVKNTCTENSADWITAVIRQEGGRNLPGRDSYFKLYRSHKADDILSRLQPMQRIYYRICVVRQIMMEMLSDLPLVSSVERSFEQYILNALANPDVTLRERMYHSFRKSRIGNPESRIGTNGLVPMPHNETLNVGPTSFDIEDGMPVEKIRLNFFFNVWDFIYKFKSELELEDRTIRQHISDINYMFPIFGVPINDVNLFSPTYLKNWMIRIQEETKPTEATKANKRETDNDVDSRYKYDLLQISRLYYESLKKDVDALEKELRDLLQEYAAEFRDNNEKGTEYSKDIRSRIGPRGKLGGSKTKRKQRRRKQKSRTKKN
jgi:hypothetical protein